MDPNAFPQYIFPASKSDGYVFNYLDSVNVSWHWDSQPVELYYISFFIQGRGQSDYSQGSLLPSSRIYSYRN